MFSIVFSLVVSLLQAFYLVDLSQFLLLHYLWILGPVLIRTITLTAIGVSDYLILLDMQHFFVINLELYDVN